MVVKENTFLNTDCLCFFFKEFLQEDDELITTIEIDNYCKTCPLPFGKNITIICKTTLEESELWWNVNDKNVTEKDGYVLFI